MVRSNSKKNHKEISSAFATGGGGFVFEYKIVAAFFTLMITNGRAPFFPNSTITKLSLQERKNGYDVDDLVIFLEGPRSNEKHKILCQVKHTCSFTGKDKTFSEVIAAAWNNYNNAELFNRSTDKIVLITGRLSKTDIDNTLAVLNDIGQQSALDFFTNIAKANFYSDVKREKFQILKEALIKANGNNLIQDNEIFEFYRCFSILCYDLDRDDSVDHSLLLSHLSQFCNQPSLVWNSILVKVQQKEICGASITKSDIPDDIADFFNKEKKQQSSTFSPHKEKNKHTLQEDDLFLKKIILIGSWNENNAEDIKFVSKIVELEYDEISKNLIKIRQDDDSLLSYKNGIWSLKKKKELWNHVKDLFLKKEISSFVDATRAILEERDPALDLPDNQRCYAPAFKKNKKHSNNIRKGIVEGLALLANTESFANCEACEIRLLCRHQIRWLLDNAPWTQWASLKQLILTISEIAPSEFLSSLGNALNNESCDMGNIFRPYNFYNENYAMEHLASIEMLAQIPEYYTQCCNVLISITKIVKDEYVSRSLYKILSPWENTTVPYKSQFNFLKVLFKRDSNLAWDVITSILFQRNYPLDAFPDFNWIKPEHPKNRLTASETKAIVPEYLQLALENAKDEPRRLLYLLKENDNYPLEYLRKVCDKIRIYVSQNENAADKENLWTSLVDILNDFYYSTEKLNAKDKERYAPIKEIEALIAPKGWSADDLRLFKNYAYLRRMNREEKYDDFIKRQTEQRTNAIHSIYNSSGIDGVMRFAHLVDHSDAVGYALAELNLADVQKALLPHSLNTTDNKIKLLVRAYIYRREEIDNNWQVQAYSKSWTLDQRIIFLTSLPFNLSSWKFVRSILKENEALYWSKVLISGYPHNPEDMFAVKKFLSVHRPQDALKVLYNIHESGSKISDFTICKDILKSIITISTKNELNNDDAFNIRELIKYLQSNYPDNYDGLCVIEWQYLQLMEFDSGISPINLERKMDQEPSFFAQIVGMVYKSTKTKSTKKPSQEKQRAASNAYTLLNETSFVPGLDEKGNLDVQKFQNWIQQVRNLCTKSGHLDVALLNIGKKLIHSPADGNAPNDLWIHKSIAKLLDSSENMHMREGFTNALYNSRGAHIIDPTGAPELQLAGKYSLQADELELYGYSRFAEAMRILAEQYKYEAAKIKTDYGK